MPSGGTGASKGIDDMEKSLRRLLAKRNCLFCRLQNIYGAAKDVFSDENSKEKFLAGSQTLEILRNDFNKITDQIIDIELQINPDAEPNFQCLNSFDELYSYWSIMLCPRDNRSRVTV
ncbi:hypothetical protein ACJJTC_001025 [Scirpophaga incertulas]